MQAVGLFYNQAKEHCEAMAATVTQWLSERGYAIRRITADSAQAAHSDMSVIICIGGDGSLIQLASLMSGNAVPVLGVNAGSLGFLTKIRYEEVFDELAHVLAGTSRTQTRFLLAGAIQHADNSREEVINVLNDVVVSREAATRFVTVQVFVNDEEVLSFGGDGIIIASPTGSTAYSLSAGGPIVYPTVPAMVITPLCPHTIRTRPLVVAADADVQVRCSGEHEHEQLPVIFDGHEKRFINRDDRLHIRRSQNSLQLIVSERRTFGDIIREKL